jgi:prevent-host-death family protein
VYEEAAMKSFSFSDLNRQSGEVLDAALAGPVTLEKRGKPRLVIMSVEAYERLARQPRAFTIEDAPDHIHAELMAGINEILGEEDAAETR